MAEYPPRSCGPCPHIAHFGKTEQRDYLTTNTTPTPQVKFQEDSKLNELNLGVPSTDRNPDLTVSPIDDRARGGKNGEERYLGGIPPCTEYMKSLPPCCQPKCCLPPKEEKGAYKVDCQDCEDFLKDKAPGVPPVPKKGILKNTAEDRHVCVCPQEESDMHATAGRSHPAAVDPSAKPPVPSEFRPEEENQTNHKMLSQSKTKGGMGPIGPWATGRVDWGPLSGLTGTRPVVDKYSIARYSEGDWRAHNKEVLGMSDLEKHKANLIDWNGRQCLEQTQADVDKNQEDNTKRLQQRQAEIQRWKCELERAIGAASEEISFMEEQRRRLKQASSVLTWPESIAGECLERRTGRMDSELVRDEVEDELIKELALCAEIRDTFARTLKDVEIQLEEDKTAKQRLEFDWSDKTVSFNIDSHNVALNNRSTILLFKPGAVCFPDEQSTTDYWEHFTRETLMEGEATRKRSVTLRGTLDAILVNAARDLRTQADNVELALAKRIACAEEVTAKLENELKQVLQRLADVEDLIRDVRAAIRRMDNPMKKAQTRLDGRLLRPRVENCRDAPHFGLIEEVKSIAENIAALQAQLNQAELSQTNLMKARSALEREIMMKRKTLEIDGDRTKRIRSYYPSAEALQGH